MADKETSLQLDSSEVPKHILISPSPSERSLAAPENSNDESPNRFPGPLWPLDDIDCTGSLSANTPTDVPPLRGDSGEEARRSSISACCRAPCCSSCLRCGRFTAPIAIFCLVSIAFVALGRGYLTQLLSWLENLPLSISLIVFILLFTLISFPFGFGYIILNTTAGYLYGLIRGQAIITVSVAIGFTVAFLLCRSCLRDWSSQYLSSPTLLALMRVVEGPHGLKVIILTRFTPVPFGLQNSLFAVSLIMLYVKMEGRVCTSGFVYALVNRFDKFINCMTQLIMTFYTSMDREIARK